MRVLPGRSVRSCTSQLLTDLVLGRTAGLTRTRVEFASLPRCGAQSSSVGGLFGAAVLPVGPAPLQPGRRGLRGAGQSRLTAGPEGVSVQGKDCAAAGNGKANRAEGRVMLCTQEPAGKPQITDIFPSTC